MNSFQIESWALRVIDCVNAGQPNEDFRVELKREWPDSRKIARRIAGHANAARGEPILWLIGVDQKDGVVGVDDKDLANWYPAVQSQFDEIAPALTSLNIPVDGKAIVALLFETDRSPFVVKSLDGGTVQREVPWREATGLRSAYRSDLIRLLAPLELLPDVEVIDNRMSVTTAGRDDLGNPTFDALYLELEIYVAPKNNTQLVIPFHRCNAWFQVLGITTQTPFHHISLSPSGGPPYAGMRPKPQSLTIASTNSEVVINGPGRLVLKAAGKPTLPEQPIKYNVQVTVHLLPTNAERPVVLSMTVPYPYSSKN